MGNTTSFSTGNSPSLMGIQNLSLMEIHLSLMGIQNPSALGIQKSFSNQNAKSFSTGGYKILTFSNGRYKIFPFSNIRRGVYKDLFGCITFPAHKVNTPKPNCEILVFGLGVAKSGFCAQYLFEENKHTTPLLLFLSTNKYSQHARSLIKTRPFK